MANFGDPPTPEVRRIFLPRTRVNREPPTTLAGASTLEPEPAPRLLVSRVLEALHLPTDKRIPDLRGPLEEGAVAHDGVALDVSCVGRELEGLHPGAEPHTGYPAHPDERAYLAVLGHGSPELLGDGPHLLLGHLARNLPTQHVARTLVQPSDQGGLLSVNSRHPRLAWNRFNILRGRREDVVQADGRDTRPLGLDFGEPPQDEVRSAPVRRAMPARWRNTCPRVLSETNRVGYEG